MRNKYMMCIFSLLSFFLFSTFVLAEEDTTCNYNSRAYLNKLASNVKVSYDLKYGDDNSVSFDISIYNIVDDIYVSYRSDEGTDTKVFASMTTDGTYTFNVKDTNNIITYTFVVRSLKFGCINDIRTLTLVKPKKNSFSDLDICKYEELEDYYYCQKWITRDLEGTDEDIEKRIKAKRESLRKSTTTRCIECEKEEAQQKAKSEYEKRKIMLIAILSGGIALDTSAIIFMIIRIRRYSI